MKIRRLEIANVRGIRSQILEPNCENMVIWGPNGSGKSAVVDAIDFLLTGRVARLVGEGTRGITLAKHGPHIDAEPKLATVTAYVEVPGVPKPISLSRCLANPEKLVVDEEAQEPLRRVLAVAERGQHVLTRREILRFLVAEAGSRAQQIQALLDLSEVETVRKALTRVKNDTSKKLQAEERALWSAQLAAANTAQQDRYDASCILEVVNRNRSILGAGPQETLLSANLKLSISLPRQRAGGQSVNISLFENDLERLRNLLDASHIDRRGAEIAILAALEGELGPNGRGNAEARKVDLSRLGLELINEDGACPLCDTEWPPGHLHERLTSKLRRAEETVGKLRQGEMALQSLTNDIDAASTVLRSMVSRLLAAGVEVVGQAVAHWQHSLEVVAESLRGAFRDVIGRMPDSVAIARLGSPVDADGLLSEIQSQLRARFPEATPEQTAWDILTRLEENLKAVEKAQASYRDASVSANRAEALLSAFLGARDEILGELYSQIVGRFTELYRDLHGTDEGEFHAEMRPDGAGLLLNVDFYGRGVHPPHALHSEGHQDSMGLCLYLALSEHLTQGVVDLTILDDVMMSVDSNHRRQVCAVIRKHFPERQFLITTHDKTWAHQLRTENVVKGSCAVEFYNWSIETGPHCSLAPDLWGSIENHLGKSDVAQAAALLRRSAEEFFAAVCDSLEATVKYRLDGRNDLGDFLPSAISKYRTLLKKAKVAAQSWGHDERSSQLADTESVAKTIFERSNAEQWAINASVHFNSWHTLTPQDFRAVFEAFQDLHGLFVCQKCGSQLSLSKERQTDGALRCQCTSVNWNLVAKGR